MKNINYFVRLVIVVYQIKCRGQRWLALTSSPCRRYGQQVDIEAIVSRSQPTVDEIQRALVNEDYDFILTIIFVWIYVYQIMIPWLGACRHRH